MTREADTFVSLRQRAQFANQERADLFVSIHVNSVPSQECHAVETYYLGPADDPRAEQLAGKENHESGYHLADFRRLLEGVYVHVRQAESRKLAQVVQQELVSVLGDSNPAIRDKGVRSAPFLVLVASESPGILAEVSCLSNDEEAGRLADPSLPPAHRARALPRHPRVRGGPQPRRHAGPGPREPVDDQEDRCPPCRHRSGHLPQLDLGLERRSPRGRELRRMAGRHGRPAPREEADPLRPGGPRQPTDARPPPSPRAGPDQGGLRAGRAGGARAAPAPDLARRRARGPADPRGRGRARRGPPGEPAEPPERGQGRRRRPDDRLRAVRRLLRHGRAPPHDDRRHRRRHDRLLRHAGPLSDRGGPADAHQRRGLGGRAAHDARPGQAPRRPVLHLHGPGVEGEVELRRRGARPRWSSPS